MESLVFKIFTQTFKLVGLLLIGGTFVAVLTDLQKNAFESKHHGLMSLTKINQQLVGSTGLIPNSQGRKHSH